MTMDVKQFKENLLIYGADVHQWPEEIRQAGLEALESSPELQTLIAEEEHFERVLKTRKYEEPSSNLEQRIISSSLLRKQKTPFSIGAFIPALLDEFRLPRPALAAISVVMVVVLIIGFAIGFSNPAGSVMTEQEQTNLQEFLYYEGDIL